VGIIAGFTGDWAAYGVAYKHGIEIANVSDKIEFIYENDEFTPSKTVSALRKLTEFDHIDAAVVGDTSTAASVAAIAEQKNLPLLVWAGSNEEFKGKKSIIRLAPNYSTEIAFAREHFPVGGKTVVYTSAHAYATAWGRELNSALGQNGLLEEFATDPGDYRPNLLKAKQGGIQQIFLCLNPGQNGLFAVQMRQLHLSFPIYGCNMLEASADLNPAREAMEGVRFEATDVTDEFRKKFLAKTKSTDHLMSAAIHHDAVLLLARSIDQKGGTLLERILNVPEFVGAHKHVKVVVDETGQYLDLPYTMYEVRNGNLEVAK